MANMKETKEAVSAFISFGNALGLSLEDGKITLKDSVHFIGAIMEVPKALEGFNKIPDEIKNMTSEEQDELYLFVKEKFSIPDERIEKIIIDALLLAKMNYNFVKENFLS